MSKARAQELIDLGNKLFADKAPLDNLNQEIAENVYPERATFTRDAVLGENYADDLMDSYPVLARRELGNAMSAIQRPKGRPWFGASTQDEALDNDPGVARFLEYVTSVTRAGLYDPRSDFVGVSKMADHDYVTFGQAPMTLEEGPSRQHLFMRLPHLRDVAWLENDISIIDHVHRKDAMTARQMKRKFGDKALAPQVKEACEKNPSKPFQLRCIVMPADEYDYIGQGAKTAKGKRLPFVIIYIDADNMKVLREGGLTGLPYVIPRWHRIPGCAYAFSPAAMTSLPDARMAQMLARIILESGEKQVDPPMVAIGDAFREVNIQAGSLTWADIEKDGNVRDSFMQLEMKGNMAVGLEMRRDVREMLQKAWFLDRLALPEATREMTAYEVSQRVEEHVRNLLPLFEPREIEYESRLLDKAFAVLDNMKRYDWSLMPDILRGRDIFWTFKNPMQEASERILVAQFGECLQLIKAAQEFAGGQLVSPMKLDVGLKDAIRGTSAPATWRKTVKEEQAEMAEMMKRKLIEGAAREIAAAGEVAQQVGAGAQQLQVAGLLPPPDLAERSVASALPPLEPAAIQGA